jgi:hypothetical protein
VTVVHQLQKIEGLENKFIIVEKIMKKKEWHDLKTKQDVENLINIFGGFHDSCLRELYLWTDHYVSSNLAMHVNPDLDCKVRALFQRQDLNPSAIEMLFEEVTCLNIFPSPINYDSIIQGVTLILIDDCFYWANDTYWSPDDTDRNEVSWISAKKIKWCDASNLMGKELIYGPSESELP